MEHHQDLEKQFTILPLGERLLSDSTRASHSVGTTSSDSSDSSVHVHLRSGHTDLILDPLVKLLPAAHYDYWCVLLGQANQPLVSGFLFLL